MFFNLTSLFFSVNIAFANVSQYVRRAMKPVRKDPQDFTMVTRGYWAELRSLSKRMPAAFELLTLITERMNRSNALVISQATIGQLLGYGRTTIHKAVKLLEEERWLQVVKVGTANAYVVNSKVMWADKSGKRYGSFFAEVIVGEDEQNKTVEELNRLEIKHLPIIARGSIPIDDGAHLPPPDQLDLLPPDASEFPNNDAQSSEANARPPHRVGL